MGLKRNENRYFFLLNFSWMINFNHPLLVHFKYFLKHFFFPHESYACSLSTIKCYGKRSIAFWSKSEIKESKLSDMDNFPFLIQTFNFFLKGTITNPTNKLLAPQVKLHIDGFETQNLFFEVPRSSQGLHHRVITLWASFVI